MALTGQEIARMVGCSVATVSRVLNNTSAVNDSDRRAILKVIEEHGHPRLNRSRGSARADKPGKRAGGLIEVIAVRATPFESVAIDGSGAGVSSGESQEASRFLAPENRLARSYFQNVIDGAIAEAKLFNHRVVVQTTSALPGSLVRADAGEAPPRGMIIIGDHCDGLADFIRRAGCPAVTTIIPDGASEADSVGIENFAGIATGFDHLRELGHTRIGYIAGHQSWPMRERYAAYRLKTIDAGFALRPDWIFEGTTNIGAIRRAAMDMLARPDRPTAIMTCYDGAALAVLQAAQQLGLSVPDDLSIVGFDDTLAGLLHPPLTTLAVPAFGVGQNAVRLLMMRQQRELATHSGAAVIPNDAASCGMRVRPKLVVRASTGRPPADARAV